MRPKITTILAIESAIAGGSLSLIRDGGEMDNWVGTQDVSKGEELLVNIDEMLKRACVPKQDLDLIAVSAGPGSFTGIRIGIATALGLKNGLDIPMASHSALASLAAWHASIEEITVAIPMGRNSVCLQSFSNTDGASQTLDEAHTMRDTDFVDLVAGSTQKGTGSTQKGSYIVHSSLFDKVGARPKIIDAGRNVAFAIGLLAARYPDVTTEPLFISKSF